MTSSHALPHISHSSDTPVKTPLAELLNTTSPDILVQTVAHELRTPLAVIMGYAQMLHQDSAATLEPDQCAALHEILTSSRYLLMHLENVNALLMAMLRQSAPRPLNLCTTLAPVLKQYAPRFQAAQLTLHTSLAPEIPLVLIDPFLAQQTFLCLLDNAVKFTPPGGTITVRVRHTPRWVTCQVKDTGIGIAAENLPCIFEPFYQHDMSPRRRYGGLGLGLSLVKTVVEAGGGLVTVASAPQVGSTFTLRWPIS